MSSSVRGTALVTGAARRIGRAIATDLGARGWAVAVHHNRSGAEADEVVRAIVAGGGRAAAFKADLAREEEVVELLPAVERELGSVTLLVNNASLFERDDWNTATRESWDRHLAVNTRAPFLLIQAMAARLPAEARGVVVNILDQRVWNSTPHFTSYTLSKSALLTLTRTLAQALAPRIRVNAVGPGPTLRNERQTEEHFETQWRSLPMARAVDPDEIVHAVGYLIDAPSVTGQMIAVDGGEHLGWAQPGRGFVPTE